MHYLLYVDMGCLYCFTLSAEGISESHRFGFETHTRPTLLHSNRHVTAAQIPYKRHTISVNYRDDQVILNVDGIVKVDTDMMLHRPVPDLVEIPARMENRTRGLRCVCLLLPNPCDRADIGRAHE